MVQKTKSTTDRVEETQEIPTQTSERSKQVSEDACCVLGDIDSLLDEVVEPALEEWEQEYDPNGNRPDRGKWLKHYRFLFLQGQEDAAYKHWGEYKRRERQWHDVRGLEWNSCVC